MKITFPLIKNFRATTLRRAFFINAVAVAIIAALTIEVRLYVYKNAAKKSLFFYNVSHLNKVIFVITSSFIIAIIVYLLLYLITGYGGGLIAPLKPAPWN
tara:strand:- start:1883 stop:2182 length:300 start_codon:yes stop_codon:yes gene_type:complete